MPSEIEVEIFRAGDYGSRGRYAEQDLEAIACDYRPERHEAPVTTDHKQDGPALGWVRALRRVGNVLMARLGGLDAAFIEKLRQGAFKKRSIELYRRAADTGRPYLRAVSFLGAASPVVKGLTDPVFAEAESLPEIPGACVWIAFEENDQQTEEPEEAQAAAKTTPDQPDARAIRAFEEIERAKSILPAWREMGIDRFFAALDDDTPLGFADDREPRTPRAWFREFLESLDPLVPFGEAAPLQPRALPGMPEPPPQGPRSPRLDADSVALHERVCRYRQGRPEAPYAEALRAVCSI